MSIKDVEKKKFNCECIECGFKITTEKHCADIKCTKCGGQMRRVERPGPGQASLTNDSKTKSMLATVKKDSIDKENSSLVAFASTADIDRDGDIILPKAFEKTLLEYRKNPVVLWAHDHSSPPIGKSLAEKIEEAGLLFNPQFAVKEDPDHSGKIFKLYNGGYLNAFSVGFIPENSEEQEIDGKSVNVFTEVELLEVSAVPVPSNRGALALRQITGLEELKQLTETEIIEALSKYDLEYLAKSVAEKARHDFEFEQGLSKLIARQKEILKKLRGEIL